MKPRHLLFVAGLPLGAAGCVSPPLTPHQVTPQRPTVSYNTDTVPAGALELESGVTYDPGDRIDTPTTLKMGLGPSTEGFMQLSPLAYVEGPGGSGTGIGDLFFGVRHRFVTGAEGQPSFAMQMRTKLPTANENEGLGSGGVDFRLAFLTTFPYGPYRVTNYYEAGFLGETDGPNTDLEHVAAVAADGPSFGHLGTFGEIAGAWSPERHYEAGLITTGVTWSERPDQVLDAALVIGFGDDAPDLQFVVGVTRGLGTADELSRRLRRRN